MDKQKIKKIIVISLLMICLKSNVWAKYIMDYQEQIIQINFDQTKPKITISAIQNTNQGYETFANQKAIIILQLNFSETIQQKEGINKNNILIKVEDKNIIPQVFRIEKPEGNTQKLILQGISGNGKLNINIKQGSISDLVGWKNEEINLSTGIYIDNSPPEVTFITENASEGETIGIIQAEKPIRPIQGWEQSNGQRIWKKVFKEKVIFPVAIDYAGNASGQEVKIE